MIRLTHKLLASLDINSWQALELSSSLDGSALRGRGSRSESGGSGNDGKESNGGLHGEFTWMFVR
jgi:hypothetical protein